MMMSLYADIGAALVHSGRIGKTKLTPICVDTTDTVRKGEPWDVNPPGICAGGDSKVKLR
jgi:hypothetical protein